MKKHIAIVVALICVLSISVYGYNKEINLIEQEQIAEIEII